MFLQQSDKLNKLLQNVHYSTPGEKLSPDEAMSCARKFLMNTTGKVYVIGNGGSSSIASHIAIDLINTLNIPSLAISDAALLTCYANDYGYEHVYSMPLEVLLQKEDLLIAISSSGESTNILQAAKITRDKKTPFITFSGFTAGNALSRCGDLNFWVPSSEYGLVETAHMFLLHTIIDSWKSQPHVKEYEAQNTYL